MQPIVRRIEAQAAIRPDHIAVIVGSTETSYADLWTQIATAATWYRDNGVQAGETVLISADSRDPYYVAAYFGAHLARAIAVPTAFRTAADEIRRRKEFVASKFAVVGDRLTELRQLLANSTSSTRECPIFEPPKLSDVAEILFTTGSTGDPKGVVLSHGNIAASAELIREFVGNTKDDTEVVTVPLTHSFGLGRLRSVLLVGGTAVLIPGLAFPQLTIRALQNYAATGLSCVPAGMVVLLSKYKASLAASADHVRYLEMGSAPLPTEYKTRLCAIFPNTRLCMHYGLTEASRSTFLEFHADRDHIDSVGMPSPGVEILIMGDSQSPAPNGQTGLIHVRAATVMQGYWNDSQRTERILDRDSGWLNTGDLGFKDTDGYVYLVGREDDVINTGGVSIIPDDLENIAKKYHGVEDCGCIGIPDEGGVLGEIPLLYVVSGDVALDTAELPRFVRDCVGGKVLKIVVRRIEKLPRSSSGKLLRQELRMIYANENK